MANSTSLDVIRDSKVGVVKQLQNVYEWNVENFSRFIIIKSLYHWAKFGNLFKTVIKL